MSASYDDIVLPFSNEDEAWSVVITACYVVRSLGIVSKEMVARELCHQTGISRTTFNAIIESLVKCRVIHQHNEDLVWLGSSIRH